MPGAALDHMRQQKRRQANRREIVDLHDRPVDRKVRIQRQAALADAGVVDQHVDAATPGDGRINDAGQRLHVRGLEGQDQALAADPRRHRFKRLLAPAGKDEVSAARRQPHRQRLADARRGPRHPRRLAREIHRPLRLFASRTR
jgi:hypothetical protein